jgi:ubiquinone/menaquinone biosynthesis C-methylase UbiE
MSNEQLVDYYRKSAADIERGYEAPERQPELAQLRGRVQQLLKGHVVLELACGAGYWTSVLAEVCDTVLATDVSPEMLELARRRKLPPEIVRLGVADALDLPAGLGAFTAVFVGFLWSHLRRDEQDQLLAELRKRVGKDVLLVIVDEGLAEGEPVARTDAQGNTYQILTAPDGERYEVPKNDPTDSALRKRLTPAAREIRIERLEHYWLASCRLK